jgi:hypothetical protein
MERNESNESNEKDEKEDDSDYAFFLEQIKKKTELGPPCPFCDEPMQNMDGDYLCVECNGGKYGPETG